MFAVPIITWTISISGRCQEFNVFLAQNYSTADKRANVSEPLMKMENFQGYSICFRETSEVEKILDKNTFTNINI